MPEIQEGLVGRRHFDEDDACLVVREVHEDGFWWLRLTKVAQCDGGAYVDGEISLDPAQVAFFFDLMPKQPCAARPVPLQVAGDHRDQVFEAVSRGT